ncbi:glycosyltransferase [Lysobacter sp. D1-1-M9]|uniref:glycosyltransferase n=1 Tax=Novilysobacter longmucuonensis TaxID=3098603 RepID=UPI002FCC9E32
MISLIVPAHNEQRVIGATLGALHGAAGALQVSYEIIVVDDASSDRTAEVAAAHGARVVSVEHRHIAAARNAGAARARGDRLVFVDADTRIGTAVLEAAIGAMQAGAIGGGAAVRLLGPLAWHERLAVAVSVRLFRAARIAPGCFVFCTRSGFEAAGGFDESYYAGEDVAISRALARHGRFVILRQAVRTSPRKLRTFSLAEHLRLLVAFAWRGRGMLKSRQHLDFWYGKRRDQDQP